MALIGCSETDETAFEQPQSTPSVQASASAKTPIKSRVNKNYLGMSIPQLEAETIRVKQELALLEADMDGFDDDDSRWDILEGYNEDIIELSKAKTRKVCERSRRARALVGIEGDSDDCKARLNID